MTSVNVTYSENAKQTSEGLSLLEQATARLDEVLGQSASLVRKEWDRREDEKGRPLFTLQISDWTGSAAASFSPHELKSPDHLRVRLYRLWGELLQGRVDKALQKVNEDKE